MPPPYSVRVDGARELRKALRDAGDDMTDMKDINQEVSWIVLRAASETVPRRSGTLAQSGRTNRAVGRAAVRYGAVYAGVIHYGWRKRHIPADPWLQRAAESSQPQWVRAYDDGIQQMLDRVDRIT